MKKLLLCGVLALASNAEAQVQKWEYGRLEIYMSSTPNNPATYLPSFVWSGSQVIMTRSFPELMTKLKLPKSTTQGGVVIDILNGLGSQGWELISTYVDKSPLDGLNKEIETYYFKRPIK